LSQLICYSCCCFCLLLLHRRSFIILFPYTTLFRSHGAPLGKDEVGLTKEYYKWTFEDFNVPEEVYTDFKEKIQDRGNETETVWKDRKSTRLNSSHVSISYAVFCLKKKKNK